ncbi:MAG: ion transporter [Bacteroidales bacterium]|nr:ion transporter [Candidatus Minthousia equi]
MGLLKRIKSSWNRIMNNNALKDKIYEIIFESDTPAGKAFDVTLMVCIVASILLVFVESMNGPVVQMLRPYLVAAEYIFTFFFTLEYLLRIYCSKNPRKYIFSFFGIIDLLATIPLYLTWFIGSARYLMVIRTFRLIRVFRVFKLFNFLDEGNLLLRSLIISSRKIMVFFLFVVLLVICIGTVLYMIEGDNPESAFHDIPTSIYWAIVTLTTVGYGDITPVTGVGRFLSAIVMLLGYTIIAVPTGIVSASMMQYKSKSREDEEDDNDKLYEAMKKDDADMKDSELIDVTPHDSSVVHCPRCGKGRHAKDAAYCKYCGSKL